jgi:hypothetical protein
MGVTSLKTLKEHRIALVMFYLASFGFTFIFILMLALVKYVVKRKKQDLTTVNKVIFIINNIYLDFVYGFIWNINWSWYNPYDIK